MGFINLAKDLLLKRAGKFGLHQLRRLGTTVAPGLERSVSRAILKQKAIFQDIGIVADSVFKAADAVTTGDSEKFIGASTRGFRGLKQVATDVKAARARGRKRKRVQDKKAGMSAEVDGQVANQPRISGDLMDRMSKIARI